MTIVLVVVFLALFASIGNSRAEVGSPLAYLSILLIVGIVAALIAIWKKPKSRE